MRTSVRAWTSPKRFVPPTLHLYLYLNRRRHVSETITLCDTLRYQRLEPPTFIQASPLLRLRGPLQPAPLLQLKILSKMRDQLRSTEEGLEIMISLDSGHCNAI